MKKIITTGLLASLLAASLYAQNDFSAFYPIENDDTPDYILSNNKDEILCAMNSSEHNANHSYLKNC